MCGGGAPSSFKEIACLLLPKKGFMPTAMGKYISLPMEQFVLEIKLELKGFFPNVTDKECLSLQHLDKMLVPR